MTDIQHKHGTAANLGTVNPTIVKAEICIETDTNRIKIGDGITPYNELPYVGGASYTEGNAIDIGTNNKISFMQCDWGVKNIAVVGTPTAVDTHTYTGFSTNDYLLFNSGGFPVFEDGSTTELYFKIKTPTIGTSSSIHTFLSISEALYTDEYTGISSGPSIAFGISQNYGNPHFTVSFSGLTSGTNYFDGATGVASNTVYYVKCVITRTGDTITGTVYHKTASATTWTAGTTATRTLSEPSLKVYCKQVTIGKSSNLDGAQVDISECYFKYNDKYWFAPGSTTLSGEGFVATYKDFPVAQNNYYGLVKPDNTSISITGGTLSFIDYSNGNGTVLNNRKIDLLQDNLGIDKVGSISNYGGTYFFDSTSGYLKLPGAIDNSRNGTSTVDTVMYTFKIHVGSLGHEQYVFCSNKTAGTVSDDNSVYIKINADGSMVGHACSNQVGGSATVNFPAVEANTTTWVRLTWMSGTRIMAYTSTNGTTWTSYANANLTDPIRTVQTFNETYIGKSYESGTDYFDGWIDVGSSSISDQMGRFYKFKLTTPAYATGSLYGLVRPDGTSITVNNGVISSGLTKKVYNSPALAAGETSWTISELIPEYACVSLRDNTGDEPKYDDLTFPYIVYRMTSVGMTIVELPQLTGSWAEGSFSLVVIG